MHVGKLVRKSRIKHKLTQVELARRLKKTVPAITNYEATPNMGVITAVKIAKAIGVSLGELLEGK